MHTGKPLLPDFPCVRSRETSGFEFRYYGRHVFQVGKHFDLHGPGFGEHHHTAHFEFESYHFPALTLTQPSRGSQRRY